MCEQLQHNDSEIGRYEQLLHNLNGSVRDAKKDESNLREELS